MKFQQRLAFDFPPEVTQKYMTDEKALQYLKDNHPDLRDIEVIQDSEKGGKRVIEMKYISDVNLPGPLKKVMGGAASQALTIKFNINTKDHTGTMEMIPGQMADKIKVSGDISVKQQGDKWVQHIDGEVSVKIFGVGKMAEKFLVEKIESSSDVENRLRNEFVHKIEDKA